jgi:hypothetical protein
VTTEEDLADGMKNDDKILACCLALDTSPAPRMEEGMRTVTRNAVLLTDDRYAVRGWRGNDQLSCF